MEAWMATLGHEIVGSGSRRVVIMNDWLCDTSTWDGARGYLDTERFTFAFADLRGYGRSRGRDGAFTVVEGSSDVIALADALGWSHFGVVGHSMSTLIALHLAQQHAARIERAVIVTPPPPTGFGGDPVILEAMRSLARADEAEQLAKLKERFGSRLTAKWAAFKVRRWRETADPEAAAAYVAMFARDGLPDPKARIATPVLAITGEQDIPPMRSASVNALFAPICERLTVTALADCGHYPMQEAPPLVVALTEQFLTS
jgi:pimeloyl-ACP methyl ester carboxylesterase